MTLRPIFLVGAVLAILTSLLPGPAAAQPLNPHGWNHPDALELVRRGAERRSTAVVDSALQSYAARGDGYVYFLLDAPQLERQSLVRTDQVAVEVYWRAPNEVRQRIVGLREQRELPVSRLYYYLDRLTVVQDNYGQSIVIADGDNVNDVPHPIGLAAERFYDYRLADSLTLRLTGVPDPVRVHEVQVRPRDPGKPAVIGSVFLEATTGALVRMSFTFTPSAYIDPRLDFINVTLENGLWQGRYWLPYEQRLEIRRELPELDLPFGTVIRTRMRIGDYRFNEAGPEWLFSSSFPVTMAPREQREQFPFERPIDAEWRLEGFGRPTDPAEIRREATHLLRERAMSGLPQRRLAVGSISDLFRYNRAEGVALGAGWGVRPSPTVGLRLHGGWAFGAEHPVARLELAGGDRARLNLAGYLNRRTDVGGTLPVSGTANTLGSLLFAADWTDPFYASGAEISTGARLGGPWSLRGGARLELQRPAGLSTTFSLFEDAAAFRPVREVDRGFHGSLTVGLRADAQATTAGWWGEARTTVGHLAAEGPDRTFVRPEIEGGYGIGGARRRARLDFSGVAGLSFGELPRQELYLLGGRGTLPGFDHRVFAGDRFALGRVVGSADISRPWARGRLFASTGWVGVGEPGAAALQAWGGAGSGRLKTSVGAGVGLFYDLLHIDVARGLGRGGTTQLIIEFQPAFWGFL